MLLSMKSFNCLDLVAWNSGQLVLGSDGCRVSTSLSDEITGLQEMWDLRMEENMLCSMDMTWREL